MLISTLPVSSSILIFLIFHETFISQNPNSLPAKCSLVFREKAYHFFFKFFFLFVFSERICEPTHFHQLNNAQAFANLTQCSAATQSSNIYYPAVDVNSKVCTRQAEPRLFSCVGSMHALRRLCPCRDFIPGQSALCVGCER